MITTYYRTLKDNKLQTLTSFKRGAWIHVVNPTDKEIEQLVTDLGLDEGLLRDATDFFEVPRFEVEDGTAYFYTRYVSHAEDDDEVGTAPILIAVGSTFVLTITHADPPFLKRMTEGIAKVITTQKTKLFIQLMFAINERYTQALTNIRREVRRSRKTINNIRNKDIIRFVALEDTLNDFISALVPTNTALKNVIAGKHLELFEEDQDLVEDLQLSNEQLIESARAIEHTIINIRSTYTTIITNSLNQVIKMLTAITIILTIPTMISSLFGMNVPIPFADHPLSFVAIIIVTVLAGILVWTIFNKKDWI